MSYMQTVDTVCRTCSGSGFTWRGRTMRHERLHTRHGITTREIHLSRLRDVCPECCGSGMTLLCDVQRTPWDLVFRYK